MDAHRTPREDIGNRKMVEAEVAREGRGKPAHPGRVFMQQRRDQPPRHTSWACQQLPKEPNGRTSIPPVIEPDRVADDLRRESIAVIARRLAAHALTVRHAGIRGRCDPAREAARPKSESVPGVTVDDGWPGRGSDLNGQTRAPAG